MAEYIEKKAVVDELNRVYNLSDMPSEFYNGYQFAVSIVRNFRKADVALVRCGEWQGTADGYADGELVYDIWNCSECGFDADGSEEKPSWKFCPNCGARMDGGTENA